MSEKDWGEIFHIEGDEYQSIKLPLDKDGKPIRLGDTVYNEDDELEVVGIGEEYVWVKSTYDIQPQCYRPSGLVHDEPDCWANIIADANMSPATYCSQYHIGALTFERQALEQRKHLVKRGFNLARWEKSAQRRPKPKCLTRRKQDSWEQLEEDMSKQSGCQRALICELVERSSESTTIVRCPNERTCSSCHREVAQVFIQRAKKLAGVE